MSQDDKSEAERIAELRRKNNAHFITGHTDSGHARKQQPDQPTRRRPSNAEIGLIVMF